MTRVIYVGKRGRVTERLTRAVLEKDGHRLRTPPPDVQHGRRTVPVNGLDAHDSAS